MSDEGFRDDSQAIYTVADAIVMGLAILGGALFVALFLYVMAL